MFVGRVGGVVASREPVAGGCEKAVYMYARRACEVAAALFLCVLGALAVFDGPGCEVVAPRCKGLLAFLKGGDGEGDVVHEKDHAPLQEEEPSPLVET